MRWLCNSQGGPVPQRSGHHIPWTAHLLGGLADRAPTPVLSGAKDAAQHAEDGVGLQPLPAVGTEAAEALAF